MIEAGVHLGLPRATASELVIQTLYGSATMLRETGTHPVDPARAGHLARRHHRLGAARARDPPGPGRLPRRPRGRPQPLARARRRQLTTSSLRQARWTASRTSSRSSIVQRTRRSARRRGRSRSSTRSPGRTPRGRSPGASGRARRTTRRRRPAHARLARPRTPHVETLAATAASKAGSPARAEECRSRAPRRLGRPRPGRWPRSGRRGPGPVPERVSASRAATVSAAEPVDVRTSRSQERLEPGGAAPTRSASSSSKVRVGTERRLVGQHRQRPERRRSGTAARAPSASVIASMSQLARYGSMSRRPRKSGRPASLRSIVTEVPTSRAGSRIREALLPEPEVSRPRRRNRQQHQVVVRAARPGLRAIGVVRAGHDRRPRRQAC